MVTNNQKLILIASFLFLFHRSSTLPPSCLLDHHLYSNREEFTHLQYSSDLLISSFLCSFENYKPTMI